MSGTESVVENIDEPRYLEGSSTKSISILESSKQDSILINLDFYNSKKLQGDSRAIMFKSQEFGEIAIFNKKSTEIDANKLLKPNLFK